MNELVIEDNEQNLCLVRFPREVHGRSVRETRNALQGIEAAPVADRKRKPS